jgi:hypothetical protein
VAFRGPAGYYRRFIKHFSTIAAPLTKLLCKECFQLTPDTEDAFHVLQHALTSAPILRLPAFNKEFIVECDASSSGIGAVLHQGEGAVAYFSRQMAPWHAVLATYEHELMNLVQAVCHWCPYLWGCHFLVCINHVSLKFLLDERLSTIPQHQWVKRPLCFDFRVEYKPRVSNIITDALSRCDTDEPELVYSI